MTALPTRRTLALLLASTIVGTCSTAASAGAFYLQEQSTRALGRAFSGEVADTGPASLWWNPAATGGMTGTEAAVGVTAILPRGTVRDSGTVIVRPGQAPAGVGGDPVSRNPLDNGILPTGAIAMALGDRLSIGLAVTSPFSFTTDYNADSWARYTADKTKLRTFDIQPSVAIAATDWLRVGVALNVEYSDATLANALPNLSAALPDGYQELTGDGWDLGWSVGAQVHNDRVTLGLSYKSSIEHKLDGTISTSGLLGPLAAQNRDLDATATFRTPWQAMAGIRFGATDRLTLNAQVVRVGWNKFDAIRLGAPLNQAIPENYRNSWSVAGGIDYQLTPQWTVRTGIQHDQTPTRDGERDARVPDGDRMTYALGASYALSPAFTLDAGASYLKIDDATIDRTTAAYAGTAVQTPILVAGRLEEAHALIFSLGGRVRF